MATSRAIAAVGVAIRRLLEPAIESDVQVKLYQASDFQHAETAKVLSVFLYRVSANTNRRNLPPRLEADGRRFRAALSVDLFYLISAWGSSVEAQHTLLGEVIRALEDTPTLPATVLNDGDRGNYAGTFRSSEAIELVYDPLSLTDMIALWDLLKPGVQPSCTYVTRAVAIESEIEIFTGEPVVERQFDYAKPVETVLAAEDSAMIAGAVLLDRVRIYGVLGLRFWDEATMQAISDGLQVMAAPAGSTLPWVEASANRSGVFAFHRLAGLPSSPFEEPDGSRSFTVEVRDEFERFLAFRFTVHAEGQLVTALESITGSPLADSSAGIPLFNTAARPAPAGMATIRVELHDAASSDPERTPAPFARLTVDIPGVDGAPDMTAVGVADEHGRVTIIVPYPAPAEVQLSSPLNSPLASGAIPLSAQTWPVNLSAAYAAPDESDAPMDLDLALSAPGADLATIEVGPFAASLPFTLAHGLGLAEEVSAPAPRWAPITPVLLVRSAVSPQ